MSNSLNWSSLVEMANKDTEFKALLLENPRLAIEKMTGVSLPDDFEYVVHEQKPGTVHLVLPTSVEEFIPETNSQNDILQSGVFVQAEDELNEDILQSGIFVQTEDELNEDILRSGVFVQTEDELNEDILQSGVFVQAEDAA